jgi:hypothetical protein
VVVVRKLNLHNQHSRAVLRGSSWRLCETGAAGQHL